MSNLIGRVCVWAMIPVNLVAAYVAFAIVWPALPRFWEPELSFIVLTGFLFLSACIGVLVKVAEEWTARRGQRAGVVAVGGVSLFLLAMVGLGLWLASR